MSRQQTTIILTRRLVMEGAWYALEQCGKLLLDAVLLYREDRFASAVGLTMVARDELGKYRLLLDLWNQTSGGNPVEYTLREMHVKKQELAAMSATLGEGDGDDRVAKFNAMTQLAWGSDEFRSAFESLGDASSRKNDRERAFYVDPCDGGWARPCETFTQRRAERLIADAQNDYRVQSDPINRKINFQERRPGLHEALEAWTSKPELPEMPFPANTTSLV